MINSIREQNFHQAWYKAIQHVLNQKQQLLFGSRSEPKSAWDSTQLIELSRHAINQVLNGEIHPQSTFKALDSYKREFTYEYLIKYVEEQNDNNKFDYLYMERLADYEIFYDNGLGEYENEWFDQIYQMKYSIKQQKENQISSNYSMATTWKVGFDGGETKSSPCLQIIQLRWNPGDLIDLHLVWRSRDLYNAWQANIVAIADMINRECILPNNCKLNRITDFSTSLHIYEGDLKQARRIIPMEFPRD